MNANYLIEYAKASKWHWWFKGRNRTILTLAKKYLTPGKDLKILDIGCGPRSILQDSDSFSAAKIFGVDCSPEATRLYRMNGGSKISLCDIENLPFKSATFTGVLMLDVLEHIDSEKDILREAIRVSKQGCIIFITVPAFKLLWGSHDIINRHKRRYTIRNLLQVLQSNELQLIKISYFNFLLFPIIFCIRAFNRIILYSFNKVESKLKSDFYFNKPGAINYILSKIFTLESKFILFLNFPLGSSIVCILKRKDV